MPQPHSTCIALLEDDPLIAEVLAIAFFQAGWENRLFTTVGDISRALRESRFDLLMLDWSLPDGEADSVIRLARQQLGLTTPIVIESVNGDEEQVVRALELGADDYVVKPLRIAEVKARVLALLRRHKDSPKQAQALGHYQLDETLCDVKLAGEPLGLTAMEFELAKYFFAHPDELLSRDQLLAHVWGVGADLDTRTVDVHVSRLRRKLRLEQETGVQISTLRGYGYRLQLDD